MSCWPHPWLARTELARGWVVSWTCASRSGCCRTYWRESALGRTMPAPLPSLPGDASQVHSPLCHADNARTRPVEKYHNFSNRTAFQQAEGNNNILFFARLISTFCVKNQKYISCLCKVLLLIFEKQQWIKSHCRINSNYF